MDAQHTPAELHYRWPAEWEPHAATWLAWPHNRETWPGLFDEAEVEYAALVRRIAEFEPVHVLGSAAVQRRASAQLGRLAKLTWHAIDTDDAWIRDYGPLFVTAPERSPAVVHWQFNAWGGKYPPWDRDRAAGGRIAAQLGLRTFSPGLTMEGGAIDGNGQGTLLASATCLLDPRRNPTADRAVVERYLNEYCGAGQVLWITARPLAGDDTDAHVDQLARFVHSHRIVVASCASAEDVNTPILTAVRAQLAAFRDPAGRPFDVVALPTPEPIHNGDQRLPASYCNFYIANGLVVVPQFDDPADAVALELLGDLFPERTVLGLPARNLVAGLGAFHCLTQPQFAAPAAAT